ASGYELWRTDGSTAGTERVADLAAGPAGSFPWQITPVQTADGLKVFFTANGALYISDVDTKATTLVGGTAQTYPFSLKAVGDKLYFTANGRLWVADAFSALPIQNLLPDPLPLSVSVLENEGDGQVTSADYRRTAAFSYDTAVGAEPTAVDITDAVRAALARGETRLTIRIDNPDGVEAVELALAGLLKDGHTGLEIEPEVAGLVADLYTQDGELVAFGKSIIDMRTLDAGGYYLRVYSAEGSVAEDVDFQVAIDAPFQGWFHPYSDRDRIAGGEGDDLIIGNNQLDRLRGESGRDRFIGEAIEVRDLDLGETRKGPALDELSTEQLRPVDALIDVQDQSLAVAIARALGYAITQGYDGQPIIHVPGGSLRTDVAFNAVGTRAWSERFYASRMAELSELDAGWMGISRLGGIEWAINLESLNLSGNNLQNYLVFEDTDGDGDSEFVLKNPLAFLIPGTSMDIETAGFAYGMKFLRNLAIDFNPLTDLSPLEQLPRMARLSFDGVQPENILTQVEQLIYPPLV
ncbi:MAG: hypothetical protein EHM83_16225, partial [Burkholderiales bacterium]